MFQIRVIFILSILYFNVSTLFCQNNEASFGGEYIHHHTTNCVSDEEHTRISNMLYGNISMLQNKGQLQSPDRNKLIKFAFPLKKVDNLKWNNFYGISGYVDQNTGSGVVQDYNCGSRTYDGHNGVDYFTWPFQWYLVENDLIHVVAAADGVIIGKEDGYSSYSCDWNGNQNWNAIYLRHSDGSVSWYGHMKENSLTSKNIGSAVTQGEYLGIVGSSGRSSGPHLHFEVYKKQPYTRTNLIEPHSGSCNGLNNESWWESEEVYQKPTINTILTHSDAIELGCPTANEKTYFQNEFKAGDPVFFSRFYKDQKKGTTSFQKVYKPNNELWVQWDQIFSDNFNASWWYNFYILPANAESGEWIYEVTYEGNTIQHTFIVKNTSNIDNESFENKMVILPNPASDIITFSFPLGDEAKKMDISIKSLTGKLILSSKNITNTNNEIHIGHIPNGLYLVECKKGDNTITKKLIIQR